MVRAGKDMQQPLPVQSLIGLCRISGLSGKAIELLGLATGRPRGDKPQEFDPMSANLFYSRENGALGWGSS
jgi:hypothetical protein